MQLSFATIGIVSALLAVKVDGILVDNEITALDHGHYFTLGTAAGGCIGLKHGTAQRGDRLILRNCTADDDSLFWTVDEGDRFHSKVNAPMCIQAGHRNSDTVHGIKMRMIRCGFSDLQKFDLTNFMNDDGS